MANQDLSKPILVEESLPFGGDNIDTLPMNTESIEEAMTRFNDENPEWTEGKESGGLVPLTLT